MHTHFILHTVYTFPWHCRVTLFDTIVTIVSIIFSFTFFWTHNNIIIKLMIILIILLILCIILL